MSQKRIDTETIAPRWKDIYRLGGVFNILIAIAILFAIIAYFIWPFKPGLTSTENIFATLQANLFGGLMSLDLSLLVIGLINILPLLALYAALKQVNESYALIALIMGLVSVTAVIPSRPLAELVLLSNKYAAATTEVEKLQYLAAGESLHSLFNGTAWMVYTVLGNISTLISCALILQSNILRKTLAYVGIVSAMSGLGVFVPAIGPILSLLATFGGVIWSVMIARDFFRLAKA
jgi:hypothetical protein